MTENEKFPSQTPPNKANLLKELKIELRQKKRILRKVNWEYRNFEVFQFQQAEYERSSGLHKFLNSAPRPVPIPSLSKEQLQQLRKEIKNLKSDIKWEKDFNRLERKEK
ncbi:hypothetical protein [Lactococcus lactis]|uniref:hypothetical protein n=1 Tax=Lactococcus lactis TaxID=1358 RepID=UPI0018C61271|nr:hypothetical protein [Lactococcus lactis]MBG1279290.1 hypothetical protein [Lactococcus lactis subsp. lactis]